MTVTDQQVQVDLPAVDVSDERLAALTATLAADAQRVDDDSAFPWPGLQAIHEAGILTAAVPTALGGHGGLSSIDTVRTFLALGKGDPSAALVASMTYLTHTGLGTTWSDALYRRVLAESSVRPTLLNAIRAEPELGAPARGGLPATTVRRTADGWVLNGHKGFGTGAEGLAFHLVWAVTPEADGPQTIGHVIVPAHDEQGVPTPGIEIVPTWDHLGMRGTSTHDIVYTDVVVPEENFQGVPVGGGPNNAAPRDGSHLAVVALYLGVAHAARDFFAEFARTRVPSALGRPIATTDRIKTVAGEIEAQLLAAEETLFGVARRIDDALASGDEAELADALGRILLVKLVVTRAAITAVETAVAALGNPGLTRANPLQRHLRDVLCSRVHPPQDDAALIAAGARALA